MKVHLYLKVICNLKIFIKLDLQRIKALGPIGKRNVITSNVDMGESWSLTLLTTLDLPVVIGNIQKTNDQW